MKIWQSDFYKSSQSDNLWQLLICDLEGKLIYEGSCSQSQANSEWLVSQLQKIGDLPDVIQVFRPQSLSLLTLAANQLGIKIEATRRTQALKKELTKRNFPIDIEQPPPQPLPEYLWGEKWSFARLPAEDMVELISDRPIPIVNMPESLLPINLGIASTVEIPGVIIYGGRKSMVLARWLQDAKPVNLEYIPTEQGLSGGLVLEAGLAERWILETFEDKEVALAAQIYQQRKIASKGLHFLLVQPDDSGITYTGFWLLGKI